MFLLYGATFTGIILNKGLQDVCLPTCITICATIYTPISIIAIQTIWVALNFQAGTPTTSWRK